MHMYSWLALLFLTFSIAGAGAEDEIPDVVNETAIEPQPSDDDDDDEISNETIIMAAAILGVCIMVAAVIMRR